ncbi:AAA family ATPase [Methylobacter svalbardensis]|uniref:AAA family ATPase n=1 Tax=Methylobacter svalbardensis TaxID=3080016 RepID=UPI0030EE588D
MQLQRLRLPAFRNLRDVDIAFASHLSPAAGAPADTPPKLIRSHALIGQNGTGKSNLIEALITIFRDIDLDREAPFDYTLVYSIRGHTVRIEADTAKQKRPFVWVDEEQKSQDYLIKNDPPDKLHRDERRGPRLLPSHIFAYYSGRNERMETLFQEHQRRYNRQQEFTASEKLSGDALASLYRNSAFDADAAAKLQVDIERRSKRYGDDSLRRLFYCRGGHSQLVLLACLLSDDPVFKKVLANLHIESLESALFVLKEPHRLREKRKGGKFDENELNEGDPRFWFARGNVVSEFLDKLWQVSWAPIEQEATKQIDFRGRTEKQKQLYLFVPTQEKLKQLGDLVGGTDSFFRYAEGAYIGDLIDEVRITVKKRDEHGGKISFTQLSEGELQMLTVLGLMRITREDHCLFLLDEPDTHLNPIWKLRYFDDIENVLSPREGTTLQGESQILITTHDPMMVGSLKREQVHILRRDGERTVVDVPDEHPQGMGVTGLLKSELFGLSSTLDIETERRLFRRNELFVKAPRTPEEDAELSSLSAELADLGFSTADFRDPDYALFVRKMSQHRRFRKPVLTPEEQTEQDAIADSIIDEILREEDGQ